MPSAFGALDHPGLQKDWDVVTDNYTFHLVTVSNFDMTNLTFNKENKEITIDVDTPHDGNLAEIQIPHNLIAGNLTTFVNGTQIYPKIQQDDRISFLTLTFDNKGVNTVNIIGTTYLPEFSNIVSLVTIIAFITMIISTLVRKF
jgi:hypothetical protein